MIQVHQKYLSISCDKGTEFVLTRSKMASSAASMETNDETYQDCLSCRLTTGVSCVAISAYIISQLRHQKSRVGYGTVAAISVGVAGLGITRLFNVFPFGREHEVVDNTRNIVKS